MHICLHSVLFASTSYIQRVDRSCNATLAPPLWKWSLYACSLLVDGRACQVQLYTIYRLSANAIDHRC